jgi:flagellar protein FliL
MSRGEARNRNDESSGPADAEPVDVVTTGGRGPWLPLLVVLVLMPALSFAMMEYLVFPRFEQRLEELIEGGRPVRRDRGNADGAAALFTHTFEDVIVNVSGTLGTRYLKASFTVHSEEADLNDVIRVNRSRLLDAALASLSSLRLQDLEQPGARNFIRSELIDALNQAAGRAIIQELYFLDFVVQ